MAINVLQYNALARTVDAKNDLIAEQRLLRDSSDELRATLDSDNIATGLLIDSAQAYVAGGGAPGSFGGQQVGGARASYLANPFSCCGWNDIPLFCDLTPVTGTNLCVWETACTDFNEGRCCQWTVPVGVDTVLFEVWGPGGNAGAGNCCGGHPPGMSGAYAQTLINVNPLGGEKFTLCAGCATKYCSYCTQSCTSCNCPSFVCSNSLIDSGGCFCMCVMGGIHNLCFEVEDRTNNLRCECQLYSGTSDVPGGDQRMFWSGRNRICNSGSNYCGEGGQTFCSAIGCGHPAIPSTRTLAYIVADNGTIKKCGSGELDYTVPGMYPGGCMNQANCGRYCGPGVPHAINSQGHNYCQCFQDACCGYQGRAACGVRCHVGMGATNSTVCGGQTGIYGDYGRQGGIRVTYC